MKIKHHPGIIDNLYPKLALVIIELNCTIISTANLFFWREIHGSLFVHNFLLVPPSCCNSSSSWTFITRWPAALSCPSSSTQDGVYQAQWSPWLKKNMRGHDSFSGLPLCCTVFIKVTLTVSTTQINYFIPPLTSPNFFFHFNRGDLVGEGWSMEPLSRAWTPEGPLLDVTH